MAMNNLRIGMYAGSWPQNIGNAFFDFGAEAIIRKAFPQAEIFRTGGAVHWMFNNSKKAKLGIAGRVLRKLTPNHHSRNGNSIEIGQFAEIDLLVFPGMSMCEEFAFHNGPTFLEASSNGVAVLGLGAGGSLYTSRDTEMFADFFNRLENAAVITRDEDTFRLFDGKITNLYSGIDCAFFLPDYFKAPLLRTKEYDVLTFDSSSIPNELQNRNKQTYFTHHDMWGPLSSRYTSKFGTLVSDVPEDYLTLYANCDVTYSDRVHACIASLAYGNSARLYSDTPRKALFTKVGIQSITNEVVRLDSNLINTLKDQQIEMTRTAVTGLLK